MSTINKKSSKPKLEKSRVKPRSDEKTDPIPDDALQLPLHPKGRQWNWRHVVAARMVARGALWDEVALKLGVNRSTATHYPKMCDGWPILFGHFRSAYLAELEDSLFEPALKALVEIITNSKNDFAKLQAASLILSERNRTYGRIDNALKRERTGGGGEAGAAATPVVIDTAIQAPEEESIATTTKDNSLSALAQGGSDVPK